MSLKQSKTTIRVLQSSKINYSIRRLTGVPIKSEICDHRVLYCLYKHQLLYEPMEDSNTIGMAVKWVRNSDKIFYSVCQKHLSQKRESIIFKLSELCNRITSKTLCILAVLWVTD